MFGEYECGARRSGLGLDSLESDDESALGVRGSGEPVSGSGIRDPGSAKAESVDEAIDAFADPGPQTPDPVSQHLDLAHIPPDDPAVYKMLQEADTVGIFQVESRAQMATLPRLRPQRFYDIVVEVAIIRPGPIVGQMVHPYLKRRQGVEPVTYPHPSLEPILARTLGVPLFQEQLLRMAMVAAGFTGGEAEELRRAFGFKRSEKRMQQIEGKLRAGIERQGITGEAAEEIIRSITSFALYGFPESHAASFALLVYASAYLKVHYPAAFFTAMLNNQPMGFYHPATLVKDAQRHGVRFAPIDVQISDWECRVEPDGRVRLGLMYVNGLRQATGRAIAAGPQDRGGPAPDLGAGMPVGSEPKRCPKCGCDDESMLEETPEQTWFCNICAHEWGRPNTDAVSRPDAAADRHPADDGPRYGSVEALISASGVRRDELATLAEIGALNSIPGPSGAFGHHRRSALWQIERAVRPSGELFKEEHESADHRLTVDPGLRPPTADSGLRPPTADSRTATADRRLPDCDCRPPTPDCDCRPPTPDCDCRPPTPDCDCRPPTPDCDCRPPTPDCDCRLSTPDCRPRLPTADRRPPTVAVLCVP